MGLPMVQTKNKRRSSLVMGVLLALLLGVAASFFVLAMPIRMLETVTTFTRLSKLMVQAEPPISPNDRTLLAVLAGILTAGIGWVLVDWLLFGRVGMGTLIRAREDDYEDDDDDAWRPTDPLDLVAPMHGRDHEWPQDMPGDTRRPLSARNDIGEPEAFAPPPFAPQPFGAPQAAMPPMSQPFPPIGQILTGSGISAPPLQPHIPSVQSAPPSDPFAAMQPAPAAPAAPAWAVPAPQSAPPALNANFDLPDRPESFSTGVAVPPQAAPAASSGMPSWLPAPGVKPDLQPAADATPPAESDPLPIGNRAAPADPFGAPPSSPPSPLSPSIPQPAAAEPPPLVLSQSPPPLPFPQIDVPPAPTPLSAPAAQPPAPLQASETARAWSAPAEPAWAPAQQQQPFFTQGSSIPPAASAVAPAAAAAPPPAPQAPRPAAEPGLDRARMLDLLNRLEAKVQNRRAAQAQASLVAPAAHPAAAAPSLQAVPQPAPAAPAPPQLQPAPSPYLDPQVAPPAAFTAPPPVMPPFHPAPLIDPFRPVAPSPSPFPDPVVRAQAAPAAPAASGPIPMAAQAPQSVPTAAPIPLPRIDEARSSELLDQPLHVTLDLLRSMVKR